MKTKYFVIAVCLLITGMAQAQEASDCSILTVSEVDDAKTRLTVYGSQGDSYSPIDVLEPSINTLVDEYSLSALGGKVAIYQSHGDYKFYTEVYGVSKRGFEDIGGLPTIEYFRLRPRWDSWSFDSRLFALQNIFDNYNNHLFLYDTLTKVVRQPIDLSDAHNIVWSPTEEDVAFVGYDSLSNGGALPRDIADFAIYIAKADSETLVEIPVSQPALARLQWLSGGELAITTCKDRDCVVTIYDANGARLREIAVGGKFVQGFVTTLGSYLLSDIENKKLFLLNADGEFIQIADVDTLVSRPVLSADETYLAFRAIVFGEYRLYRVKLSEPDSLQYVSLKELLPGILPSTSTKFLDDEEYPHVESERWNPYDDSLLYVDDDTVYRLDATTFVSATVIRPETGVHILRSKWVCE